MHRWNARPSHRKARHSPRRTASIVELVKVNDRHPATCADGFLLPIEAFVFGLEFTVGSREPRCTFRVEWEKIDDSVVEVDEDLTLGAGLLCQKVHECFSADQLDRGIGFAEVMFRGLELTGQLGDERDTLEIGCHKNSSDCRFLETEEFDESC